jgi:hypothetical protein
VAAVLMDSLVIRFSQTAKNSKLLSRQASSKRKTAAPSRFRFSGFTQCPQKVPRLGRMYAGRGSNPIRSDMMCADWLRFHGRRSRIPIPAHPSGPAGRGK